MRGVTSSAWPMTMTVGVNSSPNCPRGPAREKRRKTNKPTRTVGRLNRVTDWSTRLTQYGYDKAGRAVSTTLPNGVSVIRGFDDARLVACWDDDTTRGEPFVGFVGLARQDGFPFSPAVEVGWRLGLPLVSYTRQLSVSDGSLQADRDLEDSLQTVRVPLPALASIAEEAFPPRRTTLMDAIKAKKKPVTI